MNCCFATPCSGTTGNTITVGHRSAAFLRRGSGGITWDAQRLERKEPWERDKHRLVYQWDVFMFTVGMEDMDEARRGVGEGEGKATFLSFFLPFFFFSSSTSSSFSISLNMKRPAKGGFKYK